MADTKSIRHSLDCFNLDINALATLGIRTEETWKGVRMNGKETAFLDSGLIKPEWLPGVPDYGKSVRYIIFNQSGEAIPLPLQKGRRVEHPYGGFCIIKQGGRLRVIRLWTSQEAGVKRQELIEQNEIKLQEERQRRNEQAKAEFNKRVEEEVQRRLLALANGGNPSTESTRNSKQLISCNQAVEMVEHAGQWLREGDEVIYFKNGHGKGEYATIVEGIGLYCVNDDDGCFADIKDNRPFSVCYGYMIVLKNSGKRFFTRPHNLTKDDCRRSYLRLVHSRQEWHPGVDLKHCG